MTRPVPGCRAALSFGVVLAAMYSAWPSGQTQPATRTPYEQVLSILAPGNGKAPPANVEQVVQALPDELRSNFTFVYDSRSTHRSSVDPSFPRVVLFTTDGKLMLAFTGNPKRPGYDQIEAIHFDDRTSSFHTSRFILGDAIQRDPSLKDDAAQNGTLDQYECTRCHGRDVRPIFDSYSLWPGFYGSLADNLSRDNQERRDYLQFLATSAKTGVYRHLKFRSGSSTTPYDDGKRRLSLAESLNWHPNERLGDALTPLNWQRIVRKLAAQGETYRRLRYPLLAGILSCTAIPISREFDHSIKLALDLENSRRFERAGIDAEGPDSDRFLMQELVLHIPQSVAEVAYAAKALGVSRADWSMSFEPSSLGFFDGVLTPETLYIKEDFVTAMLRELAATDKAFAPYYSPSFVFSNHGWKLGLKVSMADVYGNPELCSLLDARIRSQRLPALEPVERIQSGERGQIPRAPAAPTAVLKRCAACHEGNTRSFGGVEIPFTDPVALHQKLRRESSLMTGGPLVDQMLARIAPGARNPMPPAAAGGPLTERERRQLTEYVSALAGRGR